MNVQVEPADNRWALTQTLRLLSASAGDDELVLEQLREAMNELGVEEAPVRLARHFALVACLVAFANAYASVLEEKTGADRQYFLALIERQWEETHGL